MEGPLRGARAVHPDDIDQLREGHPGVTVLAHPECAPEVIAVADYSGSTAAMSDHVGDAKPPSA